MDKGKKRRREIEKLEKDVAELRRAAGEQTDQETRENLERLQEQVHELMREFAEGAESASVARRAESWERVQLARHAQRPYTLDYVKHLMDMFSELHGDRGFADDAAMVGGMASFRGQPVMVIGQQKGRDTKQKLARNFGMPKPEGYRKALRLMRLAAKFKRPILTFVDTPGAYPGIDAEERGEAEAIARNLLEMARLPVPIIVTITGEGGFGGALAIAVGDRVNMLENAIYSVISPEGCASIMWRDASQAATAAEALRITAPMLKEMGIIDEVVPEPEGGAHQNHAEAARLLGDVLERQLEELTQVNTEELLAARYEKFRRMGNRFLE